MEGHVPLLYLDLDPEEVDNMDVMRTPAGLESDLQDENVGSFVTLQFVRPTQASVSVDIVFKENKLVNFMLE